MTKFLHKINFTSGSCNVILFSYNLDEMLKIKDDLLNLFEKKKGSTIKSSSYTSVIKFENKETGKSYYYKEFFDRGLKDILKNLFGFSRAKKAFKAGHMLLQENFHTPEPILFGIKKKYFFILKNFLITESIDGERTYEYIKKHYTMPMSLELIRDKRSMICAAGKEIGRLHKSGIFHGDLRVGNILISGTGDNARFYFIDNERTIKRKFLSEKHRLKNLVQLNMLGLSHITRTDRLRFISSYIRVNLELSKTKKVFLRKIILLTNKRKKHKLF